jgi:hypothetical protein
MLDATGNVGIVLTRAPPPPPAEPSDHMYA